VKSLLLFAGYSFETGEQHAHALALGLPAALHTRGLVGAKRTAACTAVIAAVIAAVTTAAVTAVTAAPTPHARQQRAAARQASFDPALG
jgi:hypothetical protein